MSGFVGPWLPQPPRAQGPSPWEFGGKRGGQGDVSHSLGRPCLPATTHLSRLWGPILAHWSKAELASSFSAESKKVLHPFPGKAASHSPVIRGVSSCCLRGFFTFFISAFLRITHDVVFIIVSVMGKDIGREFCPPPPNLYVKSQPP